jgi:cation diffusion facilitator family transporter
MGKEVPLQKTKEETRRVALINLICNFALTVMKLFAGILASSSAMLSDSAHSLSDVLNTLIVVVGLRLSGRDPDESHQYGHERFESIAAIILSALMFATGLGVGLSGIGKIISNAETLAPPGPFALVAASIAIAGKEAMYWYTRAASARTGSSVLSALALDHRSDVLASVGSFAGILGARLGLPVLDPIAALIICVFILKAAIDIFRDAASRMTDRACDPKTVEEIRDLAAADAGVICVDQLKTRLFGNRIYVDVEIGVDASVTLLEAHTVAQRVHDTIETSFPQVKHCMVHVNPIV